MTTGKCVEVLLPLIENANDNDDIDNNDDDDIDDNDDDVDNDDINDINDIDDIYIMLSARPCYRSITVNE